MIAVITADLVNSTRYNDKTLTAIIETLRAEFDKIAKQTNNKASFTLFRGDSFQGVTSQPELALTLALRLKSCVTKLQLDSTQSKAVMPVGDVRIAIGIGEGTFNPKDISASNGEAFQLSGTTLDGMKKQQQKFSLTSGDEAINSEFDVHMAFLDNVTDRWSVASSEVIYHLLNGLKEQQIANVLERSQAAINLRKKAASWDEIKLLLARYKQVIQAHTNE